MNKQTAGGMPENTAAALSYVLGLITGIVFLTMQGKNQFVRFHAVQSIGLSVVWIVGWLFLTILPVLGWMLLPFWGLVMLAVWLLCILKAYQGEKYHLPLVGEQIQKTGKQLGL